ncbi:MAG: hypothetical protein FJ297_09175 [Planctomycetes bacterium]|nr:hypothetical protein [Planctomycetota bacterium]
MRRSVPLLRSDYFHDPESQQGHTYGLSLWLPYHGSGLGATGPYFFRSCIFPASRVGWDTRKADMDYALLRRMIAEFKRVEPYLLSDYYPLTPYDLDKKSWMACQLDDPERGGGAIQVFRRAECAGGSITIRLRGLDPESTYSLESPDGRPTQSVPGDVLLREGLRITIDGRPGSALLVYQRVNRAK